MNDVTTLYDDLVAIRRTAQVMHEQLSWETREDLQVVIKRIKGKLAYELALLTEGERYDVIYALDNEYGGGVREDLEGML